MAFWLLKSEPATYPIELFAKEKKTLWTGVRNYQARNFMMNDMTKGDLFFFYHSNAEPTGIYGLGRVLNTRCVDPTQFDRKDAAYEPRAKRDQPIWYCCEVQHVETWKAPVTLEAIRQASSSLEGLPLLAKGQRLSVQPVDLIHARFLLKLAGSKYA